MGASFRQSMAWLHTWAGVVIGSVLYAIFWMGSLSVFDREIDRWMTPGSRLSPAVASQPIKLDGPITENAIRLAQRASHWSVRLPSERVPALELRWRDDETKISERRYLHPQTGAVLPHTSTLAGTGFIFPFHYSLQLKWKDIGYWLVGLAGMALLVLVVSGVVIHRKIFADFFLFRPRKNAQRASLDLHNLTGVLGLPFHFVMVLSGLIIFMGIYWPSSYSLAYPDTRNLSAARQSFNKDGYGQYKRPAKGESGAPMASLDGMRVLAKAQWQGAEANFIHVWHPGDKASYVELRRAYADSVTMSLDQLYLDAASGQLLHSFTAQPVMTAQRFISGLHFVQFEHWLLRWLYFLAGLSGCIMIATGLIFWIESRRASHTRKGLHGVRVVEALAVASVPGIMIATCMFFIANRLLPLQASLIGHERSSLEMWVFYVSWLAMLMHAAWRARHAWREQSAVLATLAATAVALNWTSTGHHLVHTLGQGLWAVAGMDLMLLAGAIAAAWTARHLARKAEAQTPRAASTTADGNA